jgi:hypothetical protein
MHCTSQTPSDTRVARLWHYHSLQHRAPNEGPRDQENRSAPGHSTRSPPKVQQKSNTTADHNDTSIEHKTKDYGTRQNRLLRILHVSGGVGPPVALPFVVQTAFMHAGRTCEYSNISMRFSWVRSIKHGLAYPRNLSSARIFRGSRVSA